MLLKGLDISASVTSVQPLTWNASIWIDLRPDCLHTKAHMDIILRVCAHGTCVRTKNFRSDCPRYHSAALKRTALFAVVLGHGLAVFPKTRGNIPTCQD